MSFMCVRDGELVDADRTAARAFLESRGLHPDPAHESSAHLLHDDGAQLVFDGHVTDLHVDPYDKEGIWGGGIWHATLSMAEVAFIHELCERVGLVVCNHQGDPLMIALAGISSPDDLVGIDDAPVFVHSAEELRAALTGGFDQFAAWRDRVVADGGGTPVPGPADGVT